jgi:non-heme chloroperoxidase
MRRVRSVLIAALMIASTVTLRSADGEETAADRWFVTSDGVRLHYMEAGPRNAPTIVFVPGWTMPAWIWQPQIDTLSATYHVVALDPRGQGESDVPLTGYDQDRRGEDIGELIRTVSHAPVLLVGWSLGVLDALAYIHTRGDAAIAGLALVDNSVGESPAPAPRRAPSRPRKRALPVSREIAMRAFVHAMFRRPQPEAYLDALTETCLRTPPDAARALLSYPVPRTYWRDALYATSRPILYVVRPGLAAQARSLALHRPDAETAVFADAGHALFVDDASRFDALLSDFARTRVWPR